MTHKKQIKEKTKLSEEQLTRLKQAFENGGTDEEACAYAGVDIDLFNKYQDENPDYLKSKINIRHKIKLRAKSILMSAMNVDKAGDVVMALKYLELSLKDNDNKNTKRNSKKWKWKI